MALGNVKKVQILTGVYAHYENVQGLRIHTIGGHEIPSTTGIFPGLRVLREFGVSDPLPPSLDARPIGSRFAGGSPPLSG
jgi:hypothetical protein